MYDFYSDTKTRPSRAMREAALEAEVGEQQKGEDPTTNALCDRVAALLGKEAAVFLPSGTMCNQIAVRVHCDPADEVIAERGCHIFNFEGGGASAQAGVSNWPIDGDRGMFTAEQAKAAIRQTGRYAPRSRLLCVEQTANLGGGAVWPVQQLDEVAEVAHEAGLATHMDGARLLNAVVASGTSAADFARGYDSCWLDFSKGLGAPVGAVLAGSADFIDKAWRLKQQMGGAMRQSGVLAAMGLYALDHNVDRMAEDHRLARQIAERLAQMPRVAHVIMPDTNIVYFDLTEDAPDAPGLTEKLRASGVIIGAFSSRRIRLVTHLDVDRDASEALLAALANNLE